MKKKGTLIKHIVDDRFFGIYFETDLVNKTIVIGKGIKRMRFSLGEAERLEFLLRRQIDRANGDYPKEGMQKGHEKTDVAANIDAYRHEEMMQESERAREQQEA